MTKTYTVPSIDEYLRERLMPVEGAIPHIPGIEMFGNSIPVGTVGGDLFEYINFQQRYDINARVQRAERISKEFLEPLPPRVPVRNSVDDHVQWLQGTPGYNPERETEYRAARSSEQVRIAEDLRELYSTAGVLVVDAQGHGIISAKIASTVHDTFHALMLSELDHRGKTTAELFERINLRLALSVTARNALGRSEKESAQEIATMLYGEVHPYGYFRFVNFGHVPPLVFSAEFRKFMELDKSRMVQFLPLGLQISEDHPDRNRYLSLEFRERRAKYSGVAGRTRRSPGQELESVMREHGLLPAKDMCNALLEYAVKRDHRLRQIGEEDRIDDKTVFIIK